MISGKNWIYGFIRTERDIKELVMGGWVAVIGAVDTTGDCEAETLGGGIRGGPVGAWADGSDLG